MHAHPPTIMLTDLPTYRDVTLYLWLHLWMKILQRQVKIKAASTDIIFLMAICSISNQVLPPSVHQPTGQNQHDCGQPTFLT
jgi:hypothetical protein